MNFSTPFKLEDLLEYLYIDSIDEMVYVANILDDLCAKGKLIEINDDTYSKP